MDIVIQQDWEQIALAFVAIMQAIKGLIMIFKTKKNGTDR